MRKSTIIALGIILELASFLAFTFMAWLNRNSWGYPTVHDHWFTVPGMLFTTMLLVAGLFLILASPELGKDENKREG
jgi:hypothetical protein